MPDDLNQKMDQLLRDYAEKRRNIPDPQMHPATRNMLQGEVSSIYNKSGQQKPGWFSSLIRFRFQFAAGLALVVLLLGVVLAPQFARSKSKSAARNRGLAPVLDEKETVAQNAPSPTLSAEPAAAREAKKMAELNESKDKSLTLAEASTPSQKPAVTPALEKLDQQVPLQSDNNTTQLAFSPKAETDAEAQSNAFSKNKALSLASRDTNTLALAASTPLTQQTLRFGASSAVATTAPTSAITPIRRVALGKTAELNNLGNALRSQFVQVTNSQTQVPGVVAGGAAPQPVLSSFQLEQLGEKLRIVDRDGSIYEGQISEPPRQTAEEKLQLFRQDQVQLRARTESRRLQAAAVEASQQRTQLIDNASVNFFNVQGLNRSLNQNVVISGQLLERTNQLPSPDQTFSFQNRPPIQVGARLNQIQQQPSRAIVGTAVIGNTNQIPIQAISNDP